MLALGDLIPEDENCKIIFGVKAQNKFSVRKMPSRIDTPNCASILFPGFAKKLA
ncbi:hypothetical protein NOC27_1634 [Nitrosococcus oceani AFC27]|nr:hypothetical protein NOC27_1634 [Nitrosococcus oceani AFC27]